jgi:hypothetical protein
MESETSLIPKGVPPEAPSNGTLPFGGPDGGYDPARIR